MAIDHEQVKQGSKPGPGLSEPSAPRVIALTGANSFLGRNLIGLLEEDPRVERIVALDLQAPFTAAAKTHYHEVDFTQPSSEEQLAEIFSAESVHTVTHLAFLPLPTRARAWAHELESVGTMHVLNAARRAQVKKLVQWSQTVLYGAHPSNPNFISESHPLRARSSVPFFRDKIQAETEALRFAQSGSALVTVLRTAPVLGPRACTFLTRYLSRRWVPTLLGHDPMCQCVHEVDALAAFKLAVDRDVPGVFNIVSDGVLHLSTMIRLAGRASLPLPTPMARPLSRALWAVQLSDLCPGLLDYLRFVCVADGQKARLQMGFRPAYTTRQAVLDFATAQHLRDVRLLDEAAA